MSHPYHEAPAEEDRCRECRRERQEIKEREDHAMTLRTTSATPLTMSAERWDAIRANVAHYITLRSVHVALSGPDTEREYLLAAMAELDAERASHAATAARVAELEQERDKDVRECVQRALSGGAA
jgi:hypothetical protein